MKILQTPDERFSSLPDWPYQPIYTMINATSAAEAVTLRVHHIDTGTATSGETVLCMHGEPSWSYLYRKMISRFVAAGHRVVAPDLVGFGRSDKPAETRDYTYERHVDWMSQWLVNNDFRNLTLVCQDWGGLIGLRLVGAIMSGGCKIKLTDDVRAAYDAPFPDDSFKAGARVFPTLVPITPDDPSAQANIKAWQSLRKFEKPFLTTFSDSDPVTSGGDKYFQREIPGCAGQPHTTITEAAHFLQEDASEKFADVINQFIYSTK